MSFDLQNILESKRILRQRLTELPIGEKLRILDALRERELAIRGRTQRVDPKLQDITEHRRPAHE